MNTARPEAMDLARRLVATLPVGLPGLFSPWQDHCPEDLPSNGPERKLERLAAHLDCAPRLVILGEAPGFLGCRHSGVAFTSEAQLCDGSIPRLPAVGRLTRRRLPFKESSATVVWRTLYRLGLAEETITWNALQMHPHRPGEPNSNRTPKPSELAHGAAALQILTEAFPDAPLVAVGRQAEKLLGSLGFAPTAAVRHPANGGVRDFERGMEDLARRLAAG